MSEKDRAMTDAPDSFVRYCENWKPRHIPTANELAALRNAEPCMCGTEFTCLADEHNG